MAHANGVPEWRLQYDIDFESVVRGHHIYKTVWKPEIRERLVCRKDNRKEVALYDENAIGVHKQLGVDQKPEFILVGYLPVELSFVMHSFLKSHDDDILIAEVIMARERENGLVVPCVYHGRSTSFQVAKILKKQLIKASALYKHMKIEVSRAAIIKKKLILSRTKDNKHCKQVRK